MVTNNPVQVVMAFSLIRLVWLVTSRYFGLAAQRARFRALTVLVQAAGPGALLSDDRKGVRTVIVSAPPLTREDVRREERR
jgi:hypothetical protein